MPKNPSSLPIEIKISTVVAISTILHSADPIAIDAALKQMTGGVSDFFEDEFAVIGQQQQTRLPADSPVCINDDVESGNGTVSNAKRKGR